VKIFDLQFLSVGERETAEFRSYPLATLSVLYKCMFYYKSPGHKYDNSLLFWACCFLSDNLLRPWIVFSMECEFDNTDMEGTLLLNGIMYQAFVHIDQWNGV